MKSRQLTLKHVLPIIIPNIFVFAFLSCKTNTKGTIAVKPFDQKKYLGVWYQIARLDYRFEKNLNNVTATYTLQDEGSIKVDNKGYNYKKEKWEQIVGKAKPASDPQEGKLKVSFFGPFFSEYNVIAIDKEYKYALVAGKNTKYLWILSRDKTIPEEIKNNYIKQAHSIGYKTDKLVWVEHNK